ncbi:MAG: HlyD family efflux transporter periplasmic adaptor subunit [Alphaproteobacteria bacterium]|nr:HlyD family efflux transporter periplasmic adaptor subunit [Alphaproteobacteria bacterium]MBU1514377.1 HlyD family efflux transporter periplasmic adaptor subunit [Alphaproteobacteria bacterium]MBU2096021.1 HlyD family efflux transporter periplasmic adaptor subunit [Alphaproteobacteria bacterium]MBU2150029.1 HlyD family efflux transporter periplasmic adaptor subunit [Alphaproteobacteria bacterium]MBU2308576.1 HlyD family efflux transporter periplasmic adaptor subunit [Alphaproteobacteria bact
MALDQGPTAEAATPRAPSASAPAANPQRGRRIRLLLSLAAVVAVAGLIYVAYWLLVGSRHVETDNAYVQASSVQVTALVSGPLIQAPIYETLPVKKGQVLAVIDPADYRLAVDRASADLDQAERRVRQYFANDRALAAQTDARTSDIAAADAQLRRAQVEYGRRKGLAGAGAVSGDELTAAETQLTTARAAVAQARANAIAAGEQQKAANVLVAGGDVASNPEVAAARTRLAQAELDLSRTVIRAPTDGIVARNAIEVGQRVQPGAVLMTVVPVQRAYVDANFKEGQLRKVRIGQPVTLTSDLYGSGVKFHGRIVGFSGGTGSAFAVIPAQNATGNWIKVVQRVPVRIALDPKELAEHPLRVGLSMTAEIDIGA